MPTYQYACTECDHAFEQFQSFSDDALTECPRCSGRLRKVYNAVGVVFKGSGFYRTDSRATKDESAPAAKADGAGDKAPEKGPGKGSENGSGKSPAAASGSTPEKGGTGKSSTGKGGEKASTPAAGSGSAA